MSMAFSTAHERFLRDQIAAGEQQIAELERRKAEEHAAFVQLQQEYEERLAEANRHREAVSASLKAFEIALEHYLANKPDAPKAQRRRAGAGRGVSSSWQRLFAQLPMAPSAGLTVSEFMPIVEAERPGIARTAVRSQLSAAKKVGRLENVDGRWRRASAGRGEEIEAPGDTSGPHRTPEASNGAGAWQPQEPR
jgi:hypothetical protein